MNLTESLIFSLYQIGAIQFGEYTLKSGQTSSVYLNLRKIISYPSLLQAIAKKLMEQTTSWQINRICGVPYTALPIATCMSITNNIPMVIRRKEKKDYGTKQMIEGDYHEGENCLIVEDVITTGGSIIETAKELQSVGLKTPYAVVLIDRQQGGYENLVSHQFQVKAVLTMSEILNTLLTAKKVTPKEQEAIQQYIVTNTEIG